MRQTRTKLTLFMLMAVQLLGLCFFAVTGPALAATVHKQAQHLTQRQIASRLATDSRISGAKKAELTDTSQSLTGTQNGTTHVSVTRIKGKVREIDTATAEWADPHGHPACWNFTLNPVPTWDPRVTTYEPWLGDEGSEFAIRYQRREIDKHHGTYKIEFLVHWGNEGSANGFFETVIANEQHEILSVRTTRKDITTFRYVSHLPAAPTDHPACSTGPVPSYVTNGVSQTTAASNFVDAVTDEKTKGILNPVVTSKATKTYEVSSSPYEYAAFRGSPTTGQLSTLITDGTKYSLTKSGCYDMTAASGTGSDQIASVLTTDSFAAASPTSDFLWNSESMDEGYETGIGTDAFAGITTIPYLAGDVTFNPDGSIHGANLGNSESYDYVSAMRYPTSITYPAVPTHICN